MPVVVVVWWVPVEDVVPSLWWPLTAALALLMRFDMVVCSESVRKWMCVGSSVRCSVVDGGEWMKM